MNIYQFCFACIKTKFPIEFKDKATNQWPTDLRAKSIQNGNDVVVGKTQGLKNCGNTCYMNSAM